MARKSIYKRLPKDGKNGITNLRQLVNKKGIYKIYESGKLVYIGSSASNLYKTILRHFQNWEDTRQLKRISYRNKLGRKSYTYEVKLMPKGTPTSIELAEYKLVHKHKPRDNKLDLYCSLDGSECLSKVKRAKQMINPKKKKKKAKPKKKIPQIKDEDLPF